MYPIMPPAPRVRPVSTLRSQHNDIMRQLKDGPVFLAQRGTLAAAILSIDEWNQIANELARLRRMVAFDRQLASDDFVEFDISQAPA
jgi:PHD/YefM family antitoxin component YafN of YafNO toxin-antitoxin module